MMVSYTVRRARSTSYADFRSQWQDSPYHLPEIYGRLSAAQTSKVRPVIQEKVTEEKHDPGR
jgi:hypothetical protein